MTIHGSDEFYGEWLSRRRPAEVWCAECDQPQPSLADFTIKGETVALCVEHIAARFPSELMPGAVWMDRPYGRWVAVEDIEDRAGPLTESEKRLMDGNR